MDNSSPNHCPKIKSQVVCIHMIHITILTLGKLKESFWRDAESEYVKRLSAFVKLTIIELKEESFSTKDNPATIKQKEALKITAELAKLSAPYIVALDEHGKTLNSMAFAKHITTATTEHSNNLVFIIGGPLGLDPSIAKLSSFTLSLSSLTFTHQMVRIFLLEQVYRAMMIQQNRPYHY